MHALIVAAWQQQSVSLPAWQLLAAVIAALGGLGGLAAFVNARTNNLCLIIDKQQKYICDLEGRINRLETVRTEDASLVESLREQIADYEDKLTEAQVTIKRMGVELAELRQVNCTLRDENVALKSERGYGRRK